MGNLSMARQALGVLTSRIHTREIDENHPDAPGYTPLIDVFDDVGRAFTTPQPDELREMLAALAAGREALEHRYLPEDAFKTPWAVLVREKDGAPYAAGAFWAVSALIDSFLREIDFLSERDAGKTLRGACRETLRELLDSCETVRPGDVVAAMQARGRETDRSTVSKAIADLLECGEIEPAPGPEDATRRYRYYARSQQP